MYHCWNKTKSTIQREFMELFKHNVKFSNIIKNYLQTLSISRRRSKFERQLSRHIKSRFPLLTLFSLPTQNSILVFAILHTQLKCTFLKGDSS